MKVIYIEPTLRNPTIKRKASRFFFGRKFWVNQEGFFLKSLAPSVICSIRNAKKTVLKSQPDVIVLNSKATVDGTEKDIEESIQILKSFQIPLVLFISNAKAEFMFSNKICDQVDLIFKREPYKDLNKYELSQHNKDKVRITMLPNPLIKDNKDIHVKPIIPDHYKHDLFFIGKNTNPIREEVWKVLAKTKYKIYGGIINSKIEELKFPKLNKSDYRDAIVTSKINLALAGIGEFTYRHLEALSLGSLLVSHKEIEKQNLPIKLEDGVDYVSFSTVEDLMEKIDYYLKNENDRLTIAKNGFEKFKEYYSFSRHGEYIHSQIREILA